MVVDVDVLRRFKERSRLVSDGGCRRVVVGYSVVEDVVVGKGTGVGFSVRGWRWWMGSGGLCGCRGWDGWVWWWLRAVGGLEGRG